MITAFDFSALNLLHEDLLPVQLTNDNAGRTQSHRKTHRRRVTVSEHLKQSGRVREPFRGHTGVVVIRVLGSGEKLWDSSSVLRGNWKEIEDALVELGWWEDDDSRFISWTVGLQDASQRDSGPATWVKVFEAAPIACGYCSQTKLVEGK